MKTIKLKESDLSKIVERVINETKPKIGRTIEPPERNFSKSDFKPELKPDISLYDKDMRRKEITQKVVDRIMKYGDMYLNELIKLNSKYPIKKNRFGQY